MIINFIKHLPSGITVAVDCERATGAIMLHLMLYFLPSMLNALESPSKPSLAELTNCINKFIVSNSNHVKYEPAI